MSMQRGCVVIEKEPNQWFCVVANREHDYEFETCTVYGPAKTENEALKKMQYVESNPGGYSTVKHEIVCDYHLAILKRARSYNPMSIIRTIY